MSRAADVSLIRFGSRLTARDVRGFSDFVLVLRSTERLAGKVKASGNVDGLRPVSGGVLVALGRPVLLPGRTSVHDRVTSRSLRLFHAYVHGVWCFRTACFVP